MLLCAIVAEGNKWPLSQSCCCLLSPLFSGSEFPVLAEDLTRATRGIKESIPPSEKSLQHLSEISDFCKKTRRKLCAKWVVYQSSIGLAEDLTRTTCCPGKLGDGFGLEGFTDAARLQLWVLHFVQPCFDL